MSIVDDILRLLRRNSQAPAPAPTTAEETSPVGKMPASLAKRFAAAQERRAVVEACRQMYSQDPRAEGVLRMLARDAAKGGFALEVTDGVDVARAQAAADGVIKRVDMAAQLGQWVRLAARDGDTFLELAVTRAGEIVGATRKPTLEMYRNCDDRDRFPDPKRAFFWTDQPFWFGDTPPATAIWFPEFLIVQARWNHDSDQRYGTPEFATANSAWRRVTEGEFDIAVRRKTRSGMKFAHRFPEGTPDSDIQAYIETNKDALNDPYAAIADFFGTVEISAVQGDARLAEIGDVEHHIQTWSAASPVPLELLAYGANLNRDVLTDKKEQYDETLDEVRDWIRDTLVMPIVERQWLLAGIWPDSLTYSFGWQAKAKATPAELVALADLAARLRLLGVADDVVYTILHRYLPEITPDMAETAAADSPERLARALRVT